MRDEDIEVIMPLTIDNTKLFLWICLAAIFIIAGQASAQINYGLDALEQVEDWPLYRQGVKAQQISSSDPLGGDVDGSGFLYVEGSEVVIFDQEGPGCVYRIWIRHTQSTPERIIKFYFDNESVPRIATTIQDIFSGQHFPLLAPLVGNANVSSGGYYCYYPLPFARHLKVTFEGGLEAHQITYHHYPAGTEITSYTGEEDPATVVAQWQNTGSDPKDPTGNISESGMITINPAQTETVFSYSGGGSITGFQFTPTPNILSILESLILQFYWDDSSIPQVECTFGSFFGSSLGPAQVDGLPVGIDGNTYYCYFPMPFWDSARLEVYNSSINASVDLTFELTYKTDLYEDESGYFCVSQRSFVEATYGQDMVFAEMGGHGQLAGALVTLIASTGQGAFHGDMRCYLDGQAMPIIQGTDFDGDFNVGDYFQSGPFTLPMHGVPVVQIAGERRVCAYRYFLGDLLPFSSSIILSAEHGHSNKVDLVYSSVIYSYSRPEIALILTDQIDIGNEDDEALHNYNVSSSLNPETHYYAYPGVYDNQYFFDDGRTHYGTSTFTVSVNLDNQGVRLVRRRDASVFPQNAIVYVDGDSVGIWWDGDYNFFKRWSDSVYEIPAQFTQGALEIEVSIETRDGFSWTEYYYQVYSHIPPIIDTTPPGQVTGLEVMPKDAGSQMQLEWNTATDETGISKYRIYRTTSHGVQQIEENLINETPLIDFIDRVLQPGTYYYYRVSAVDFAGNEGEASVEIEQRTSSNFLLEGEWFVGDPITSGDSLTIENMTSFGENWSNHHMLKYHANAEMDSILLSWTIAESDTYDVSGYFTKGPGYGIFNLQIDGTPLGASYDLYSIITSRSPQVEFGTIYLEEGEHEFLFKVVGKHSQSSDYNLGIDNLLLTSHYLLPVQDEGSLATPFSFQLVQNYPNPFNSTTRLEFSLPKISFTDLSIYDLLGRRVDNLMSKRMKPGNYVIEWQARDMGSGIYFVRLAQDDRTLIRKIILLK